MFSFILITGKNQDQDFTSVNRGFHSFLSNYPGDIQSHNADLPDTLCPCHHPNAPLLHCAVLWLQRCQTTKGLRV